MSNCCKNYVNEFVSRRRKFCIVFCGLIIAILAIGVIYLIYNLVRRRESDETFDYLVLSVSWPISFCKTFNKTTEENAKNCTHKCELSEDNWTIHGLWPNKNGSTDDIKCSFSPFSETELEPIRDQLNEYWPTKNGCQNNSDFWQHEWRKHGDCASQLEPLNTQLKYFQRTLELYKEYNVTKALENCTIRPNDSILYEKKDIIDCFKTHFNVTPRLSCKNRLQNKTLLNEIRFCFNKELILQDCKPDTARKDNCKQNFTYPAHVEP